MLNILINPMFNHLYLHCKYRIDDKIFPFPFAGIDNFAKPIILLPLFGLDFVFKPI